jgi:hypothetical protein
MVNETEIQVEVPKNKQGNVSISVESEGSVSAAKNYFVGIPLDVLNKMPVLGFRNTFITKYSDHLDGNKEQNFSCGFELLKAYNQIESAVWSGNILTVKGKITYTGGLVEEHLLILTFSEDGSKVKRTSPPVSYRILGMAEGYATWPNEFMLWFEFSN